MLCCSITVFLFIPAGSFVAIAAAVGILIAFQCSITPISDSLSYDIIEQNPKLQFGKIRLVGSISFAIVALALGKAIQYIGINFSFIMYSIFMLGTFFILFGIKHKESSSMERPNLKDLVDVIKNLKFSIFLISVMLVNIMLGAHGSYITVLIEKTGGNVSSIGFVWFAQAISELPLFFIGNRLIKKYGELNIYNAAVLMYVVRMYLSSICSDYNAVISIQLMQSITYPIYLLSIMQYVNKEVPSKIKASGMTMMSALGFGLGGFIGSIAGGSILQSFDVFVLYKAITAVCAAAFVVGMLLKYKEYIQEKRTFLP